MIAIPCSAQVPAIVAKYAGKPDLLEAVEEAVRVQQNNTYAVAVGLAAARILEKVVLVSWQPTWGNIYVF